MDSQPTSSSSRQNLLYVVLLVFLVLAVFGRTLSADFVHFDDGGNIYLNPHIRGLTGENLRWMFGDCSYWRRYMPLGWLGVALTYEVNGLRPALFHLENVLFHAANSVMVFLLIRKLLRTTSPHLGHDLSAPGLCSALAAGLWAVSPLTAEPVAWASGRFFLQASFFLLISLLCYLHSQEFAGGFRRFAFLGLSVLALLLSLLS